MSRSNASAAAQAAAGDPVIAAAGDIACDPTNSHFNGGLGTSSSCRENATSNLIVNQGLSAVLPLGDEQYACGGLSAFTKSYGPGWGRVKSITRPIVGNHEYEKSGGTGCDTTGKAGGYFTYFGAAAGDPTKGYYSYDLGSWHIVALNSNNSCKIISCGSGSAQELWLKADLAAHPASCTLAYWHGPRFYGGATPHNYAALWSDLYAAGADVVLNGHVHNYQRFAPQDPNGNASPQHGIREFIVGTGGAGLQPFGTTPPAPNTQTRNDVTHGVLKLTLHPTSYDWQFVPAAGKTYTDSGTAACH